MMKFIKRLTFVVLLLVAITALVFQLIFDIPEKPEQLLIGQSQLQSIEPICYQNTSPKPINNNNELKLVVWNIYKQNRSNWQSSLDTFSDDAQLILLQEASLTDEFKAWMDKQDWGSNYVKAFSAFDISAGVVNLANHFPITACAHTAKEPWLMLPKSGLYAVYLLSNGQQLAVVNIHSINFVLGTLEYRKQIEILQKALIQHSGPIIMAGDFNTWSEERLSKLREEMAILELKEVAFSPDERKRFINGLPLDHIFYKGLKLINAKAPITDASDHSPLIARFRTDN